MTGLWALSRRKEVMDRHELEHTYRSILQGWYHDPRALVIEAALTTLATDSGVARLVPQATKALEELNEANEAGDRRSGRRR